MKTRFSFPQAIAGAGLAYALAAAGVFAAGARGCHDLSWGVMSVVLLTILEWPVTAIVLLIGGAIGGYAPKGGRRNGMLAALVLLVLVVSAALILTTPQVAACKMDL